VKARGNRERTSSGPLPLGAALGELVENLGIAPTLRQYSVIVSWQEIVGEQIAKVATAQRFDKDVLIVSVRSAPWRAELSMRRREIVEKINKAVGATVVKDIRFR
jgi:predicted nucleic acid-binding Zn ribbon protein